MSEWKEYLLGEACSYVTDKILISDISLDQYISTENMVENKGGVVLADKYPSIEKGTRFTKNDILVSNIRPYLKKIWYASSFGACSNDVLVFRANENTDSKFLYYLLSQNSFFEFMMLGHKGTKMPRGDKDAIICMNILIPSVSEQKVIAEVLSAIDDKIDFLNRQNKTLENLAETYFRQWFIEDAKEEWEEKGLDETAEFLNGLPLQKYPYKSGKYLKAIKIKELNNGFSDSSDLCNDQVPDKYIVNNGDIIFSWSGSLEIAYWKYGKGALNQHLFKVTPNNYPKWFCYQWINYYLIDFRGIAADKATTMGHIQRHHLSQAKVLVPRGYDLEQMNEIMDPITKKIISNNNQVQTLKELRETYLPKLISGEIRVKM